MVNQLEHANIRVRNIDEAVKFLTTALPNFAVRGGVMAGEDRWLHIGTDDTYLALNEDPSDPVRHGPGLNHIGFVVDDAEAVRARLVQAGYQEGFVVDRQHPSRKRIYYLDGSGMEWEFVQYYSDDPAERNDYSL